MTENLLDAPIKDSFEKPFGWHHQYGFEGNPDISAQKRTADKIGLYSIRSL
jgi:hypothetical protein